jgi:phosphohistidine phosphatase SixA
MKALFGKPVAICLIVWFLGLSVAGCTNRGSQSSSVAVQKKVPRTANPEEEIWSRLKPPQQTHYFVLMRHALAPGTGDPPNFKLGDCSTQRNLSEEGRAQAKRTGQAFKQRNIEVKQVLSSQWCRCLDTAKLLDVGPVKPFPPLNSFFRDPSAKSEQTAQVREFMRKQEKTAGVTVMVTHFVNISALSGSGVASGEMVVMEVNRDDQLEVVGRIDAL